MNASGDWMRPDADASIPAALSEPPTSEIRRIAVGNHISATTTRLTVPTDRCQRTDPPTTVISAAPATATTAMPATHHDTGQRGRGPQNLPQPALRRVASAARGP
jgi:hypothetical protein